MQFSLPSNLQSELLAYDPKLKVFAKEKQAKKTSTKPRFPLGKIPCLIPTNIVKQSDQEEAITRINQEKAPNRWHVFTMPVNVATPEAKLKVIAILYHYEQVWYAAWLPAYPDKADYIYGHAYAFKNTSTAAKTAPKHIWNSKDQCEVHDIGRGSQLFTYSRQVTREDIINQTDWSMTSSHPWKAMHLYCRKGIDIQNNVVNAFERSLKENIPVWEDSLTLFERIRCKNIHYALGLRGGLEKMFHDHDRLTVDTFVDIHQEYYKHNSHTYSFLEEIGKSASVIKTPAIKKLLQAELDRSNEAYNYPGNCKRKVVLQGYESFKHIISSLDWILEIWPDCPVDYFQTHWEEIKSIKLTYVIVRSYSSDSSVFVEWLREHMPVASFFKILRKQYESDRCLDVRADDYVGYPRFSFFTLNDTFSMCIKILESGATLEPPKRWRINEFHDYVQAEAWKISNPNDKLHQDLFPEPIRVKRSDETWTFFQPIDTHQLAQWGQACRNCVGSASHYAEDIKKRKHFIVLCMIDGKPTFTIQLKVDNGLMSVIQIAGVANKSLDSWQRDAYAEAFKEALTLREAQLKSS